ncbi:T9SS type A sorting domain-containing protein [bacterium]|nr:T9SS type A sorting domain-containing protein [bacterium]
MGCKKINTVLVVCILLMHFGLCFSIELISETAIEGFGAKFIRVEHNTAMLFELDTSRDTMTVYMVNCTEPLFPEGVGEFELPSSISGSYYEYHPLDTNDSLLVVLNDTNTIDFYKHLEDTLAFLYQFTDPSVYRFFEFLQLNDTLMVVNVMFPGGNMELTLYNISVLRHINILGSINSLVLYSFETEGGLLCASSGITTVVYSLECGSFLYLIGYFYCGSDWHFQYLDIHNIFIFAEGRANAYINGDTLVTYEWYDAGVHEHWGVPFEIWEHYIIKAGADWSPYRPMTIAEITAWYPHPTWTWIDTLKGEIFEIDDSLLYTFKEDTLRIYNLNSLVSIEEHSPKPTKFTLSVYPNPFNSSTTLQFTLDQSAAVEANIYNLLGEKVSELVNDKLPSGVHTVHWEAENCPSGIYFLDLETGNQKEMKKILLVR